MNAKFKNIIFDFGGVIVDLDIHATVDAFRMMGADTEGFLGKYGQQGLFRELETGGITEDEFCHRLMPQVPKSQILDAWNRMLVGIPVHRLEELKRLSQHYNIALLSNTNDIHWQYSVEHLFLPQGFKPEDYFQHIFLSQRMHMAKPDEAIFRRVLEESGYRPEETLYVDDSSVNCQAFAQLGVHTFCPCRPDDWLPKVASIGFFDGVHRGHRYLIDQVCGVAAERQLCSTLLTFDRHPRQVLQEDFQPALLTTTDEKLRLLSDTGVDVCRILDFDHEMSRLTARQFMQQVLRDQLNVRVLVMGYDHRFGHGGGSFDEYVQWGSEVGIDVIRARELPDAHASSSECRRLLAEGRVEEVSHLMDRPYTLSGEVVSGRGVGHELGFPTANVKPDENKLIPCCGVYAVRATLADGQLHAGMLNIGTRPTIDNGQDVSIEVHLLDYEGDLYGQRITLEFVAFLREEQRFSTRDDLVKQLQCDRYAAALQLQS